MPPFTKVLIANRGEIAVRVLRACRELGLKTVAVFSDADRRALHVRYADEAYHLGPSPASESYLRMEKIIDIARQSGAEAIHPGYGFLAENAAFAAMVEDAGLTFIGPKPDAIAAMGDKVEARRRMRAAGVPVVPGTEAEADLRDDDLLALAPQIGFPLMIKAAAGGGGKGMRIVRSPDEMPAALRLARQEAQAAFGDARVYLEKMIEGARHIEVQILADAYGNIIHLGERECSIQRRHQKLLEEAPSPFVDTDEDLRQRLGAVAVRAAAAVNYVNAGTVEFLMDRDKNFYFLEMNTRIQVEHPVTEAVTGVDIVKEQLRIARGRQLRYRQSDIKIKGWAIESRINAEDPYNDFLPSTGTILYHAVPTGPGVRVDTGVFAGFEITPYYDSLISKLIVWGETRAHATLRLRRALEEYKILGVRTNIPFHQNLLEQHRFMAGQFDTRFVEERFSMEDADAMVLREDLAPVAALLATLVAHKQAQEAAQIIRRPEGGAASLWKRVGGWKRPWG